MPQALIVTDKRWYAIDVYVKQGNDRVKLTTKGPFQTTPEQALEVRKDAQREAPMATLVGHVYDDGTMRWMPWR
jgi:hypothetical protein